MTCEAWDVVAVPFPFTEKAAQKRRPALILSRQGFNQHGYTLMAMITSSSVRWSTDCALHDFSSAGLSTACFVRLKLFTIDNRLIVRRLGRLSDEDRNRVAGALQSILPF